MSSIDEYKKFEIEDRIKIFRARLTEYEKQIKKIGYEETYEFNTTGTYANNIKDIIDFCSKYDKKISDKKNLFSYTSSKEVRELYSIVVTSLENIKNKKIYVHPSRKKGTEIYIFFLNELENNNFPLTDYLNKFEQLDQEQPTQNIEPIANPLPFIQSLSHEDIPVMDEQDQNDREAETESSNSTPSSLQNIIDEGCFLPLPRLEQIFSLLKDKKNLILQGAPGTGKTWLAKRLGYALIGEKNNDQLRAMQFHSTMSYEDFVRGWRPSADGKLELRDGPFMEMVETALAFPKLPFVLVIEEINRGNPAQIFGELLTLLEADKRCEDEALHLGYETEGMNKPVYIPENLHIIGTMNVADRSLALVDFALRRRFAFVTLEPCFDAAWKRWMIACAGLSEAHTQEIARRMKAVNDLIAADPNLGRPYQIGHSFVTRNSPVKNAKEWFNSVVDSEIEPLLREYWFDAEDKVQAALQILRSNAE